MQYYSWLTISYVGRLALALKIKSSFCAFKMATTFLNGGSKKPKVENEIEYPSNIRLPSKDLVQSCFEQADSSGDKRKELTCAGILSLDEVLLPAIAHQEETALKDIQAFVQRDKPKCLSSVMACRKAVYDCVGAAMKAVKKSQMARKEEETEKERQWEREQFASRNEQMDRNQEAVEFHKAQQRCAFMKKWPKNQAVWRDYVFLMTEATKLQKEESQWKSMKAELSEKCQELLTTKESMKSYQCETESFCALQSFDERDQHVISVIEEIELSSARIFQALGAVSDAVSESERLRLNLYDQYRREHQFQGYHGVKDVKGLLRCLSQSQET